MMLKESLQVAGLFLSLSANAEILSLDSSFGADTITRDTITGLEWLDVTLTGGLSYNQMIAELQEGGDFYGWRYATSSEFDQLISNWGYMPVTNNCDYGVLYCDSLLGENPLIEEMIITLGDTTEASLRAEGGSTYITPGEAGGTYGLLANNIVNPSDGNYKSVAFIADYGISGSPLLGSYDLMDLVQTYHENIDIDTITNSYLVRVSEVPIPAATWLFGSALLGLIGINRRN